MRSKRMPHDHAERLQVCRQIIAGEMQIRQEHQREARDPRRETLSPDFGGAATCEALVEEVSALHRRLCMPVGELASGPAI